MVVQIPSKSRIPSIITVAVAIGLIAAGTLYRRYRTKKVDQKTANSGYADPATCAICHAAIAATYRETGMGRSFHQMTAADRGEDFKVRNTLYNHASDRTYTMLEHDGAFYESRQSVGFEGKPTEPYEKSIDYVIGSGNDARTYLHRTSQGKLIELPVSWYSESGGRWGMSPGYDRAGQMGFRRAIEPYCMFCHNAYPAEQQGDEPTSSQPIFQAHLPDGIDCQRCHGPGAAHVKAASTPGTDLATVRNAIVNPAKLSRGRQMEVCMQCHLETTSLPLPNSIRQYDRSIYSYRPGKSLADYRLYFDHKPGTQFDDRVEVAGQAYRLARSACFIKSKVTCLTCHDPHNALHGEQATAHYVAICKSCHTGPHPVLGPSVKPVTAASNCLTCHMWKRRADDVVNVIVTDHYIQRFKPKRDFLAPLKETIPVYHGEVVAYYPKKFQQIPDGELYLATAQVSNESDLENGIPRLRDDLERLQPKHFQFYSALGSAYSKIGDNAAAVHWYDEALQREPESASTLRELSGSLAKSGDLNRAAEVGEKAAAMQPPDTDALTNLGNIYIRLGRFEDARRTLQRSLTINPDMPDTNDLLGLALLRLGDLPDAEAAFRKALQIEPDFADAQNNLGDLLAQRGEVKEAAFHLQRAIAASPSDADAHRSYALLFAMTQAFDKAAVEMKEAVQLNPKSAPFHVQFADILEAAGHIPAAQDQYMQAIQLDPSQAAAHLGLGSILAAEGRAAQAEQEFRLALKYNPQSGEAHLALAEVLVRRGALSEAHEEFQAAAMSNDPAIRQAALKALQ